MASSPQQPISLRTGAADPTDAEILELTEQVQHGHLEGLRQYLARTRSDRDWQDRLYVLEHVAPKAPIGDLDAACEAEPEAADLFLIRCAYYSELSKTMRGVGTADQVGTGRFQNSAECVKAALADMAKSTRLDSQDPTCCTIVLKPLTIFSQETLQRQAFERAIAIAPDLVPAYFAITTALSKRWGGSHEASVSFARNAMKKAGPGSDMATCLFWAHNLAGGHFVTFDKDPRAAKLYTQNIDVRHELDLAFDNWTAPPYIARRSSIPFLRHASGWYRWVQNEARLARVVAFTKEELHRARPVSAAPPKPSPAPAPPTSGRSWLDRILGSNPRR